MNKAAKRVLVILLGVILFLCTTGCKKSSVSAQENSLLGKWKDVYGLTEYQFLDDSHLKFKTMGLATFNGTYTLSDDCMTVNLTMIGSDEKKQYSYRYENNRFFLNNTEFVREHKIKPAD